MSRCPNCGQDQLANAAFCVHCGASLPSTPLCRQCGYPHNPLGASHCTQCGAQLKHSPPGVLPIVSLMLALILAGGIFLCKDALWSWASAAWGREVAPPSVVPTAVAANLEVAPETAEELQARRTERSPFAGMPSVTRLPSKPTPTPDATPSLALSPPPSPLPSSESTTPDTEGSGAIWMRPVDEAQMVYVPAGSFVMGSTEHEIDGATRLCSQYYSSCTRSDFENERPRHRATMSAFWIDQTEVTAAQYTAFLNRVGRQVGNGYPWLDLEDDAVLIEQVGDRFAPRPGYETHPATQVSWDGAEAYCLSVGGRLPTEAEWEYAARGPENLTYPWGNELSPAPMNFCDLRCGLAHADGSFDDGYAGTSPVGSYPAGASWCGALDMAGNVWEWVADWYQEDAYVSAAAQDPAGPVAGKHRGLRGGSWFDIPSFTRGANRYWDEPTDSDLVFGFRCVVSGAEEVVAGATSTGPPAPCEEVTGTFAEVWNSRREEMGCAVGLTTQSIVVEEQFQMGTMYWREAVDVAQALVRFANGMWRVFEHAPYQEGSPELS